MTAWQAQPSTGGLPLIRRDADAPPAVRLRPPAAVLRAGEQSAVARAAVALGVAGLPILRPTVPGNLGPADGAIFLGIAGSLFWLGASRQVLRGAYIVPVALAAVGGLLAGLFGTQPSQALLAVVQDVYLALWAMACVNLSRRADAAGFMVRAWCASACAWGVLLFVAVGRTALSASGGDTRLSFTSDTNGAGLYFVLSIFVIAAARYPRRRGWRASAIAFLLVDTVLTGSLGALSGLFAGLAVSVILAVLARRGPAPAVALVITLAFATASGVLYAQQYRVVQAAHVSSNPLLRNSLGRGAQSSDERAQLTRETLGLVRRTDLIGSGPNTTKQLLRDQQAPYTKQAHNDWIAALVERGALGLLGLVVLTVEVGRRAVSVRDVGRLQDAYAEVLPAAHYLTGGLATVFVFSLSHEVLHDRTAWTLLGLIAAFALFGSRQTSPAGGGQVMRAVVTGAAGFIGSHLCEKLLSGGAEVVGIDAFTDYYDPMAKRRNAAALDRHPRFALLEADLADVDLGGVLHGGDTIFHLAGQPGVRASWGADFSTYVRNNVLVTQRLLEACKDLRIAKFVYASSSSVYGDSETYPTAETLRPSPVSPYGVTKLAAEHLTETYRKSFGIPAVSLRLFTVYGPRQRPDMAFARLVRAGLLGTPFVIYGDGLQTRDFTYVDDVVCAMLEVARSSWCGVANIGGGSTTSMMRVLDIVRGLCGSLEVRHETTARGDVRHTAADTSVAARNFGYRSLTPVAEGLAGMIAAERAQLTPMLL